MTECQACRDFEVELRDIQLKKAEYQNEADRIAMTRVGGTELKEALTKLLAQGQRFAAMLKARVDHVKAVHG